MSARNFAKVQTEDALKILVDKLFADGLPLGFDIETGYHGPNREKGALYPEWDAQFPCGFSITNDPKWARYIPTAHDYGTNLPDAWEIIKPALEELPVIAHNMKFESRNLRVLDRKGIGPNININIYGDSALQSYALSEYPTHGLKALTKAVFDYDQAEIESLFPSVSKKALKALRFNTLDTTPEVVAYACDDAALCLALWQFFGPKIEANPNRAKTYDLEMRVLELLIDLEDAGHAVDWIALGEQAALAEPFKEHMIIAAREGLSKLAGGVDYSTLNLNSAPQMRKALYQDVGLSTTRKTDKGELSTDATALEGLSKEHVAVKKVLEVREVGNLAGRLKKWMLEYSIAHDKRVHASFNQVIVGSGRFSANDPAIQQLPKQWGWHTFQTDKIDFHDPGHKASLADRATLGKHYWIGNFRDFLIADDNCYLLMFDYSQIELRILAGLSQEPYLLEAFANGIDIHTATAAQMLNLQLEEVQDHHRAKGKTLNFGLLYQMGVKLLAESLGISFEEAQDLYDRYFAAFTKVRDWINEQKIRGKSLGYVETYFGRKVTLWDLQSGNFVQEGKGERLAVNAPVQGSAADYMKISMLRAQKVLQERGWWMTKVRMINNLHDALTFEADNDIDPNELRDLLIPAVSWPLPNFPEFRVDWEIGKRWGSAAKWKDQKAEFIDGEWTAPKVKKEEKTSANDPEDVPLIEPEEEPVAETRDLIVEVTNMPDKRSLQEFLMLVQTHAGNDVITIKTPEGDISMSKYRTSLTPKDQGSISMTLGGAKVYYPQNFEISNLTEGL